MVKDLVSLLTPAYNSGAFIHRLLDSVLEQDYPQIEMVVADDGSADNTRQKVESYIPKFAQRGYSLKYLYKENGGQASAINMGLPLLQGEFIAWPDSDDYYSIPTAISSFVKTLKPNGSRTGVARTRARFIGEDGKEAAMPQPKLPEGRNFIPLLQGTYPLTPITYMVRAEALDKAIPGRHIYDGQHPQNIQLFAPITYLYEVRNTDPGLVTIVVRHNSDSHAEKNLAQQLEAFDSWIDIYHHTLDNMAMLSPSERRRYKAITSKVNLNDELALCFHQLDRGRARQVARKMKESHVAMHWKKMVKYMLLFVNPQLLKHIQ